MARKTRIHFPEALYHVIVRGNARQDIFFGDADRCRFLLLLQEEVERFGYRVHAFLSDAESEAPPWVGRPTCPFIYNVL